KVPITIPMIRRINGFTRVSNRSAFSEIFGAAGRFLSCTTHGRRVGKIVKSPNNPMQKKIKSVFQTTCLLFKRITYLWDICIWNGRKRQIAEATVLRVYSLEYLSE